MKIYNVSLLKQMYLKGRSNQKRQTQKIYSGKLTLSGLQIGTP